jgi:hypothetical protein
MATILGTIYGPQISSINNSALVPSTLLLPRNKNQSFRVVQFKKQKQKEAVSRC